jgi:dCMP deaminase
MDGEKEKLKRKKYNDLYIDIATRISKMSFATRLKVGSILVKNGNIISFGWNGMPSGFQNECEDKIYPNKIMSDYEQHYDEFDAMFPYFDDNQQRYQLKTKDEVLHAEQNVLMKVTKSTNSSENADMFITHAPCLQCAKLIYQSGIRKVFYRNIYRNDDGVDFLKKCGVEIEKV